ncbi:MAG: TetR/AcrR family transcriptional regulator [Proteobacteria bacterium]|nr:TetR/AcrR family transcriptional regulator [Pseudomonadota bacterium]
MKSPDSSEKKRNSRYQAILNAAAKCFMEKGYHHANISDIANEVGLLKGSIYYYIKSKEQLLAEIVFSAVDLYTKALSDILTSNENADQVIKKAVIAHIHPIGIEYDFAYIFLNEMQNLSIEYRKEVNTQIENYEKLWLEIVEKGKKEGIFKPELESRIVVLSIFGMCNWTSRWYRSTGKYNTKELGEMYANIILDGIKAM